MALRELIAPQVEAVIARVVQAALAGDMAAARLLLERSVPALRPRGETLPIPAEPNGDLAEQGRAIVAALIAGTLAPAEAVDVIAVLASAARLIESTGLEERVRELEKDRAPASKN